MAKGLIGEKKHLIVWVSHMTNFYITVSNGLLKGGHKKRMGSAVWEFMWLLDKITKVDSSGCGHVLGGKPVTLSQIAKDLESHENSVSTNLNKLNEQGYIEIKNTGHGIAIKVAKAKKRFTETCDSQKPVNLIHRNLGTRFTETCEPLLYDNTVDNTVDTITNVIEETSVVSFGNKDINEGMTLLHETTGHVTKTQMNRNTLNRLYKSKTKERVLKAWAFSQKYKDESFCPQIRNFMDLEEKWIALEDFARRGSKKQTNSKSAVYMGGQA